MKNTEITNHAELMSHIVLLRTEKSRQEQELRQSLKEFADRFDHLNLLKTYLHEFASDKNVQVDLAKVGLNLGVDFIIRKVMGTSISSMLIEKLSSLFISGNMSKILSGISTFINRDQHPENKQV